jgi:hypothetical protein
MREEKVFIPSNGIQLVAMNEPKGVEFKVWEGKMYFYLKWRKKDEEAAHFYLIILIYKKYLLNTAQLCWADENRFAKR